MTTSVAAPEHPLKQKPPRSRARQLLLGPNLLRATWMAAVGAAFAFGLVVGLRAIQGLPLFEGSPIVTVILIAAPLFFLVGIGGFDYWGKYMIGAPTEPEDHSMHGATNWKDYFRINTDHKVIGIQYTVTALFFLLVGGALAEVMRAELAQPGQQIVDSNTFNGLFSVHASLMIFLVIIPIFAGLANFVLPLMIGAPDMAFPRLNALSYWLLPVAGIMMVASFLVPDGGAFNTGWTAYAPLSTDAPLGQQFFTIGVQFAGTSSIMTALNFLVTIITMRAPGMTFWRMPLLVWANFTTSLLVVIATPFIAGSQFLVLLDRSLHANFFDAAAGGDVISYQHIFWFYSHPAVYIMMLPGFGIISEVISTKARKPIFGYRLMALSLLAILVLGFTVWAHHMFVSGMFSWLRVPMMITTMLIAVPTGIKIFSWLATLWKGVLELSTPMLFALGFITMFTLGGISGIMLAAIPVDIHTSDSVLRGRAHPLRALRREHVHDLRGHLLLVPEDDGADVRREARQAPFLAHVHLVQRHLRPDALGRPRGHATPRGRLRRQVRSLESRGIDRRLRAGRRDARVHLQLHRELGGGSACAGQSVACPHARVAGVLAAADLQLRRDPAGRGRPLRVRDPRRRARGPERRPGQGGGSRRRR